MTPLKNRLSILAAALSNDARQAVRAARLLGYSGTLFDARTPALDLTQLSQSGRREFRHILAASNLALIGLRHDLGAKGLGPGADVERAMGELDRAMEAATGLGAPLLCADIGPLPPAEPEPPPPALKITSEMAGLILLPTTTAPTPPPPPRKLSNADRAFAAQLDVVLADLCARADRYSVTLAIRSDLASLASLHAVLSRASCPWLGLDLDPVAVLRDSWSLDEILSRLASQVRHVRARDAVLGADHRTRAAPIGAGSVNWSELLDALDAGGFSGWIGVDPTELSDRIAAAGKAVAVLQPRK